MKTFLNFAVNTATVLLLAITGNQAIAADAPQQNTIKLSGAAKCHDERSSGYQTINTSPAYPTMLDCLTADPQHELPEFYQKIDPELYQKALEIKAEQLQAKRNQLLKNADKADVVATISAAETTTNALKTVQEAQQKAQQEEENNRKFQGFNWNPALAALFYKDRVIKDISINKPDKDKPGTVRIGKEYDTQTALMIEVHYFYKVDTLTSNTGALWGTGPFIATSAGGTEKASLGTVFGAGWMLGMKTEGQNSMNIGVGWFTDQDITVLRNNYTEGSLTDESDSAALIRKTNGEGWFLMFSATF